MTSQTLKILAVVVALAAIAIIVPNTNSFVILLATRALAFAILVMSLDILLGYTGLASLGPGRLSRRRRLSRPRSSPPNTSSAWAGISGWWSCSAF